MDIITKSNQVKRMAVCLLAALILALMPLLSALPLSQASATGVISPYWSEKMPAGDEDLQWHAVATNSDGTKAIAAIYEGRLYMTANTGQTWQEVQPVGDESRQWRTVAMSADGETIAAGELQGHVYISTDSGETWTERRPSGFLARNWVAVAISADGESMAAASYLGRLYTSTDSGETWTERQPAGSTIRRWSRVEMSADGSTLLAGRAEGRLHLSTDGGENWEEVQPAGDVDGTWYALGVSSNGAKMVAGNQGGRLYVSSDTGETWQEVQPAGDEDHEWTSANMSSDGAKIIAGVGVDERNGIYVSENGGTTWRETFPGGSDLAGSWRTAVSRDGNRMVAASYGGRLYMGYFWSPSPTVDTNNDGIPDNEQPYVSGITNPVSNLAVGLEVDDDCSIEELAFAAEDDNAVGDTGFIYDNGLMQFALDCGDPGYTATITQYYYGVDPAGLVLRKYNPTTNAYFTINDATLSTQTIHDSTVTVVTYQITDGGVLDVDGEANGVIIDPVGLASQAVNAPNTGLGVSSLPKKLN